MSSAEPKECPITEAAATRASHPSTMPTNIQPAIATSALGGSPPYDLEAKLIAASQQGFRGVEIYHPDLMYLAATALPRSSSTPTVDSSPSDTIHSQPTDTQQLAAAYLIRRYCVENKLSVIALRPFLFYELVSRNQHAKRMDKLRLWFRLAHILGTDLIQIPSNFLDEIQLSADMRLIVNDLQEVTELGLRETPIIRFAYEAVTWAPNSNTWDRSWEIVRKVNRNNFGLRLDSFNILAGLYGDPISDIGMVPNPDSDVKTSLKRLLDKADVEKIFLIEVVDAECMREPMVQGQSRVVGGEPTRKIGNQVTGDLLYGKEKDGYLSVAKVLKAMVEDLGCSGWILMDVFSRTTHLEDDNAPGNLARKGKIEWSKIWEGLSME